MTKEFIALDIETTGLDPETCKIIEFGAAKFDEEGVVSETFSAFANPGVKIPPEVQSLSGITDEMIVNEKPPIEVWRDLLDWCGRTTIFYAHNSKFEARFIKAMTAEQGEEPNISFICTYEVAKKRLKDRSSYKLVDLVPDKNGDRHRALPDAMACIALYRDLAATYKNNKIPEKTYLKHVSEIEMYDKPTGKQLSYIEALGGNQDKVKTKDEASLYIDELKRQVRTTKSSNPDNAGMSFSAKIIIAVAVGLVLYIVLQA